MKKLIIFAPIVALVFALITTAYYTNNRVLDYHHRGRKTTAAQLHKKDMHVHPIAT